MCQHSWYDKNRRHYGPKPNTRRARGLPRRDKGKRKVFTRNNSYSGLPDLQVEEWIGPPPEIPQNERTQMIYIRIYNYYVNEYGECRDKVIALQRTMAKFGASDMRVAKAIRFAKYVLATQ